MQHRRSFVLTAFVLLTGPALLPPQAIGQTDWKAGVAVQKITPAEPMWMSGYASRSKPAEGTLHDLWAKALVLEDPSGSRQVMVCLDLVGIGRDLSVAVCKDLQKKHGFSRSQIALFTSHTHTGPVVGRNLATMYFLDKHQQKLVDNYSQTLRTSVLKAVDAAVSSLEPSVITYGLGQATFAVNRRNNREADVPALREAGELQGPVDHSVPVIAVRNPADKLKAVVFGYACHATVLSFYQWSGDWPGFAQLEVEKQFPGTVALFAAGCGADQNPLPRRTVELAEDYGRQMGAAVSEVLNGKMRPVTGKLSAAYQEIDLALAPLPDRDAIKEELKSSNKYIAARAADLLAKLDKNGSLDQTYPYPVQVWGIGQHARLVTLGGEVVVDYSLRIRRELQDRHVWVAGYANDVMAYIPSKRVLKEGGYEGASSMIYYGLPTVWSDNVEEHVVATVHALLKQVDGKD